MKKLLVLLLILTLLPLPLMGAYAETPCYTATARIPFHIRREADSDAKVISVRDGETIYVYDLQDDWCKVGFEDEMGYAKREWIWCFRSLDAAKYPVPGTQYNIGMLQTEGNVTVTGGNFTGLNADPGSLLVVYGMDEKEYTLPVWRDFGSLPLSAGTLYPFVAWETAQPGELIGGFTTYYNESTGKKLAKERAFNIDLCCQRIDGLALRPLERFSFNVLCGPYKKANGYKKAPNISKEGVGYGGGVCQVTTTLYNALLPLPLQILDWATHSDTGIPYARQSFDAAVGSFTDLIFTNTLPYPIQIRALPQNGAVTVLLIRDGEKAQ